MTGRCCGLYHKRQQSSLGALPANGRCFRGQQNSLDAVLAIVVFALILTFTLEFWAARTAGADEVINRNGYQQAALSASDLLLKSPGVPNNWEANASNAQSIGWTSSPNVLSGPKIGNFSALDYERQKNLTGLWPEFYFEVTNMSGSVLYHGGNSSYGGRQQAALARFGLLNGQIVRIRWIVYG
ncbi:MAG: hypothetical protein M1530_00430 [Candidatus Marsarchaeota archaeon]|nr:hypothetical protein [Candidatus Marsarchaeota archaeon]